MGITAKELAEKLDLSAAAVSMALNNKKGVSTKTRQRVIDAAEKYGYDFTRISEKSETSGTICLVIYKKHGAVVVDTPFFSLLSEGISEGCNRFGYKLNIFYLYEGEEKFDRRLEDIKYSGYSGIILLGTEMHVSDIKPFLNMDIPIVLLDTYFENIHCNSVLINNVQGAYLATSYIIKRLRSQPGYLKSAYSISNFEERANGFYNAVRTAGMSASRCIVHKLTPSVEGAYLDMKQIIASGEELAKCYFADNDLIAFGAIKAMTENNIRVPEDISVVGFDNISEYNMFDSKLTTINVPKKYMGSMAAERLISIIKNPSQPPIKIEIMTSLIKRDTVI